jgi:hypothetical protein
VTLLLATVGFLLVLIVKPINSLLVYYCLLIWYPASNTVQVAMMDFSVPRIICIALLLKLLMNPTLMTRLKMEKVDILLLGYFISQLISGIFTTDMLVLINNRFGWFLDTCIPYFMVRIIIRDKRQLIFFIKAITIITVPLVLFAIVESTTHKELLSFGRGPANFEPRWGLDRARATFDHPIYFGVFMTMVFGLSVSIWKVCSGWRYKIISCCLLIGVFACLSSGGWLCALITILIILLYKQRQHWRLMLKIFIVLCILIEIFSNRHFYDVIDRFAFNSKTAWYRSRLLEVALFEGGMSGHWVFGYGYGVDPMWCSRIDGRDHTDIVNQYLYILVCYGVVGLIPYIGVIVCVLQKVYRNLFQVDGNYGWLMWCFGAVLIGLLFTFFSVSLFGQTTNFIFLFFSIATNLQNITYSDSKYYIHSKDTNKGSL